MTNSIPPIVPVWNAEVEDYSYANTDYAHTKLTSCALGTDPADRALQADNPSSPAKLLCMLAEDSDLEIRMSVADNPSTPFVALAVLAQDESDDLRYQLAENHNIDARILELLVTDSNPYVTHRAKKTLTRLRCCSTSVARPMFGVWARLEPRNRTHL